MDRDMPCANKKGNRTPIIRLLASVWHASGAVESWPKDGTVMLRFPKKEPPG